MKFSISKLSGGKKQILQWSGAQELRTGAHQNELACGAKITASLILGPQGVYRVHVVGSPATLENGVIEESKNAPS